MLGTRRLLILLMGLACTGTATAQIPVSDSDFVWIEPPVTQVTVEATHVQFNVAVMLNNSTVLGAVVLPLTYADLPGLRIDTTVSTLGNIGVTYGPAGRSPGWTIKTSLVDQNNQGILLGFISFSQFDPADDTLCYVHFEVAPETNGSVPLDSGIVSNQHLALVSAVAFEFKPTWTAGLLQIGTGIGLPGDMDCDTEVTVGDIIFLVNHLFKGGPEPCVLETADVDCDGQLALADVIWLVNYLFRGGPAPLPPCD